jgi:lipopolysaccharide transport system ATP-binding protein
MGEAIIKVENLSKSFTISHETPERYTSLRDVMANKAKKIFSFPRRLKTNSKSSSKEEFWALQDVHFEINAGERVGIIGRNGAGKSTLLKILSRITEPSKGRVSLTGRVASLLEVGTGFHPELTGRENIYLNGAILGMNRNEIRGKFDEIVAFAEVEKFLDTPVKRYSSGMYVRLAFAVAAHLEPEVLIVDEVLAVGDAQFQKKCLGKMEDISRNNGRTVLFVSHNMAAIQALTKKGILLEKGSLSFCGEVSEAIRMYSASSHSGENSNNLQVKGAGKHTRVIQCKMQDSEGEPNNSYIPGSDMVIKIIVQTDGSEGFSWELFLVDASNFSKIALSSLYQIEGKTLPNVEGVYSYTVTFNPIALASGVYFFDISTSLINVGWDHYVERVLEVEVPYSSPAGMSWDFRSSYGFGNLALIAKQIDLKRE